MDLIRKNDVVQKYIEEIKIQRKKEVMALFSASQQQ
jgi:hypothetical protein